MKVWTKDIWLYISVGDLKTELEQCKDEGKDLTKLQGEFDALMADAHEDDMAWQAKAGKLLDKSSRLRVAPGGKYKEPSDLLGIQKARRNRPKLPKNTLTDERIHQKAHGAWLGRAAGCLLGKPVEGRMRGQIKAYLESQGRWPLADYFSGQADEAVRTANEFRPANNPCYIENITCMVEDDDTNYTTTGLAVVEQKGKNFTPADVARFWLGNIPLLHVCTAERIAYRNLAMQVPPPAPDGKVDGPFSSASYRNPYREWIGAQIRADFFGYVNPGNPERAADYAWRDGAISHIKNGIYGEMWVAAMLAGAYLCSDDAARVIYIGLGEIPAKCRLREDIDAVFAWHKEGIGYEQAVDRIHQRWNEAWSHHWCHTNSNAQIVAAALLWGNLDFTQTICYAVMAGLDTDCNGATAGSVLGMMLGADGIPVQWTKPMNDTLETGVAGYHRVKLSAMADKTLELIRRDR